MKSIPEPEKAAAIRPLVPPLRINYRFHSSHVSLIPLPLKVFVISAGMLHTRFSRFLAVILLAHVIRYFGEAYIGYSTRRECAAFSESTTPSRLSARPWALRLRWFSPLS